MLSHELPNHLRTHLPRRQTRPTRATNSCAAAHKKWMAKCHSPQPGPESQCSHRKWTQIWQSRDGEPPTHGNRTGVTQTGHQWLQPPHYPQPSLKRAIIHMATHKALEQPRRCFTSLKLCKCSQIPHPSPRAAPTPRKSRMLRLDTSWEGGRPFPPISKLLGLTRVVRCN